jgi:hypothetical protein
VAGNLVRDERKSGRRRFEEPLESMSAPFASHVDSTVGPEQLILAWRLDAAIQPLRRT